MEDIQADILSGDGIDIGYINLVPEFCGNLQVQAILKEIVKRFLEKVVIDY